MTLEGTQQQAEILSFLGDPLVHDSKAVRRIDTHASIVFLAGERALKVKRAIKLPYLDYSSLEKRRAACERELELNQPHAPQIYRRVIPITREPASGFRIGGSGEAVEWALEMTRFNENQTLDHIASTSLIDETLATRLADTLFHAHEDAEKAPNSSWVSSIPDLVARNSDRFRSAGIFPSQDIERLDGLSLQTFNRLKRLLDARANQGFVRRCHGDLHLANIVRIEDRPVLFDAIEFDDAIVTTDILYDLAFTLMDLLKFDQPAAANILINRYISSAGDAAIDGLCALPLFMSLRAGVRANVLSTRHVQDRKAKTLDEAQSYFRLAERLVRPAKPMLLAIGGSSGTGKSVVARILACETAPPPGAIVLRSDVFRKRQFGVAGTTPLPAEAYRPEASARVYGELCEAARRILTQGLSVIADAAYLRPEERIAIQRVAAETDVGFHGVFLKADLATRIARINARRTDVSDATAEVAKLQERYEIGPLDWADVDSSGDLPTTIAHVRAARADREFS
jgi:aminoglycoside phosphotransferase family enzyme/predicted kinase